MLKSRNCQTKKKKKENSDIQATKNKLIVFTTTEENNDAKYLKLRELTIIYTHSGELCL